MDDTVTVLASLQNEARHDQGQICVRNVNAETKTMTTHLEPEPKQILVDPAFVNHQLS
jgi:hypothetical protein